MEATSEGGTGGSFGTGNTNSGTAGDTAADPKKVVRGGTGDDKAPDKPVPKADPPPNKTASKIPTAKAKMVMPRRKQPIKPPYPETLKSQGIEADVPVVVSIDETGKVTEVKIAKSSSYPAFDEAARKAALAEVFEPATRDGVPVPYTISYTYRFRLEEK
jgi:protein TonB